MIYTAENRGIIQNQQNFHQKVLFQNMRIGKCMPTDIDGIWEFNGKVCIMYELKYGNTPIPYGQKTLMERTADKWTKCGDEAVVFRCQHMTEQGEDISLANSRVTDVYYNGRWIKQKTVKTARERTMEYLKWCHDVKGLDLGEEYETFRRTVL